jgi:hypothetical protein
VPQHEVDVAHNPTRKQGILPRELSLDYQLVLLAPFSARTIMTRDSPLLQEDAASIGGVLGHQLIRSMGFVNR